MDITSEDPWSKIEEDFSIIFTFWQQSIQILIKCITSLSWRHRKIRIISNDADIKCLFTSIFPATAFFQCLH